MIDVASTCSFGTCLIAFLFAEDTSKKDDGCFSPHILPEKENTFLTLFCADDSLFMATLSSDLYVANWDVIPWDLAPINPGNNFDTSLHAYVAPVDGYYQ